MANITHQDLVGSNITGINLFNDSESFMQDLSEDELNLHGGGVKHPQITARETIFPVKDLGNRMISILTKFVGS
jgi:hypothetical protein